MQYLMIRIQSQELITKFRLFHFEVESDLQKSVVDLLFAVIHLCFNTLVDMSDAGLHASVECSKYRLISVSECSRGLQMLQMRDVRYWLIRQRYLCLFYSILLRLIVLRLTYE